MAGKKTAVFGIYPSAMTAEQAVDRLLGAGFSNNDISVLLPDMGIPEYEAKRYEGRVKKGGVLLSVHCESSEEVSKAKKLLERTGAEDIASAGEKSVSTHGVETEAHSRR